MCMGRLPRTRRCARHASPNIPWPFWLLDRVSSIDRCAWML
jgi:hypothetical protein